VRDLYYPLQGMVAERSWEGGEEATPLDRLAVAVGRSVARANAALAQSPAPGGVALVSSLTIRLAVEQTNVGQGRVLVTLARPGQETPSGQYVELTMSTVPGAEPEEPTDAPQAGTTTTAQQNSTPAGDSARTGVRIIAGDQSRR
ncbi:MAG TPA: hypothetical protein VK464_09525, partial [Symbiobacteriaceae bacterium]|nr:hypothetical protein [Symbiobacteriaceae bacterium]